MAQTNGYNCTFYFNSPPGFTLYLFQRAIPVLARDLFPFVLPSTAFAPSAAVCSSAFPPPEYIIDPTEAVHEPDPRKRPLPIHSHMDPMHPFIDLQRLFTFPMNLLLALCGINSRGNVHLILFQEASVSSQNVHVFLSLPSGFCASLLVVTNATCGGNWQFARKRFFE